MALKMIMIIVLLTNKFSDLFCCELNATAKPLCNSIISAFHYAQPTWDTIDIYNTYNQRLVSLNKTSFRNINSLVSLYIKNSINDIEPETFKTLEVVKLILEENELENISPQSLHSTKTALIVLRRNGILELPPNIFGDSPNLSSIFIEEKIRVVHEGVFNKLRNLQILSLRSNEMSIIKPEAFYGLFNLDLLDLGRNKIQIFISYNLFSVNNPLTLILDHNKITLLKRSTFYNLYSLRTLDLRHNLIISIESGTFLDLLFLKDLYLSNNYLVTFSPDMLPPYLAELNLSYNNLTFLSNNLLNSLKSLKVVSVVGNPFQCPCWNKIRQAISDYNISQMSCANDFLQAKYPICVTHVNPDIQCEETIEFAEEFSELYYKGLYKYETSPECNDISEIDMTHMSYRVGRQILELVYKSSLNN